MLDNFSMDEERRSSDFIAHNVWLHDRLVVAVITDGEGRFVQTQLALVAEHDDPRPAGRELALAFLEGIDADNEATVESRAIDAREMFADAFLHLLADLNHVRTNAMLSGFAAELGF